MRRVVESFGLVRNERDPVDRVVGEERVPLVVALLVEQARLADDEADQLGLGRIVGDGGHHIVIVMYRDHARYWLRIEISLVPIAVTSGAPSSAGAWLRCRLTHGLPPACSPAWMPR